MAEHRINHLEVELHGASVPVARAVSERLGQIHGRRVVPVLDRVCEELAAGEELVRLDRLEVDLGTLPADGFEDGFVARLEQALRAALAQALRRRG
ncbi:MAG TPA: contractile injection system tape measure protein, partial [Kofleriaceae bacterium]